MVHYLDTEELLIDLLEELTFPHNTKRVLDDSGPLRMWTENIVNAFKARRLDESGACIAGTTNILRKYCKHRHNGRCVLVGDTCQFRLEGPKGGDIKPLEVTPCPECGGDAWHRSGCSIQASLVGETVNL